MGMYDAYVKSLSELGIPLFHIIGNTFFPEIADLFVILDLRVADGQHHPRFRTIQFLKREIARLRRFERTERPEKSGIPDSFNGAI